MKWLHRLERQLRPWAIPNLTMVLIVGMVAAYLISVVNPQVGEMLELKPKKVLQGEVWRLFTFLITPGFGVGIDPISILFFAMYLMFLQLMGSALEATWGTLRFNIFVLISYVASIASAVLVGIVMRDNSVGSNLYIYTSIFLAFAYLFPDFQILLFFFLPVKVKWLGLLTLAGILIEFAMGLSVFFHGGWLKCVLILAANLNLSIFLGREIAERLRNSNRKMLRRFEAMSQLHKVAARHTCVVCGATNLTHPDRDFRYCPQCQGTPAYCNEHLAGHQHLAAVSDPVKNEPKAM
jgi:hypothetical protein